MSTAFLRTLCAVILLAGIGPAAARAQNEGREEGEDEAQKLPEIAPREIEIRGELQLSFPSLERQPLRGFASPATIPSVPEGRAPYVESYKQTLDDLPESLPAPSAVSQPVSSPDSPKNGFAEIGGGRYVSRFAKGRVSLPLTSRQRLSFLADYSGTEGFSPFSETNVKTPSDDVEARVQFESRHDRLTVRADLHGTAEQYTLYGVPTSIAQDTAASPPDRSAFSGGTALQFRTHGSVQSSVRLSYNFTQYTTQLDPTDATSTATFSEGRLAFDGSASFAAAGTETTLDLVGTRSTYGGDVPSSSAYSVDGGLALQLLDTDRFSLRAGGRFLGFKAPADPADDTVPSLSASFIVPQGRATFSLLPALTVYGQNTPGLSGSALSALYAENPYAAHAPSPRPTLFTTDAEAGLRFSVGPLRVQSSAGYRYAPSYRYFVAPAGGPARNGSFAVDYESARILHGGLELALQGLTGVEASAGARVRDGALVGDDASIPYFSPMVADVMLSFSFADQRGLLQTTGTIEGARPVDRAASAEVRTDVSFDVEGSYEITPLLDLVLRLQNVAPRPPKQWARYPRPPTSVKAGFRMHW